MPTAIWPDAANDVCFFQALQRLTNAFTGKAQLPIPIMFCLICNDNGTTNAFLDEVQCVFHLLLNIPR